MEFRLLGPVEAQAGDRLLAIGHRRQRAVLAVLLLEAGRSVTADRVIDCVWGEHPPASVRNVLSGHVARLRTALAAAEGERVVLARRSGGFVLAADPSQVDLFRFRRLATDAASTADVERAASMLYEAVGLWRGTALVGLHSLWLNAMRDTLELERHAVVLDLNDLRLQLGEHTGLVSELVGQAAVAPADERLIGQLMLAMYRCGRQAEAMRWFAQTRSYLTGELGTGPGPDLRKLHERILRKDPGLALPSEPVAVGSAGASAGAGDAQPAVPVPRELPGDVAAFTGRANELAALDELLLGSADRAEQATAAVISAVSGTAGVGKTALAVHWAHRAAAHFPDGTLHVNLRGYDPAPPATAADALAGFLRSLGVRGPEIPAEQDERAARYRSLLAGKQMLIVLDNASTVEQVRPLLPGHQGCRVVVTSRDSLPGLVARDGARRLDLDALPLRDAIALLRELIGDRAIAEPQAVEEVAQQCARLPLALRVAAELATSRPATALADLVAELADQQARLDLLSADGDPRTAVRAVFSWSYDHLDAESARAFRLAGLHPGADFEPYAIAALTDSTHEQASRMLDMLTRAHLAQPTTPGRYGMHDLLRAYARDQAAEVDGEDLSRAALTLMFDHYVSVAANASDTLYPAYRHRRPTVVKSEAPAPHLSGPDSAKAWLDTELGNLVAMAVHAAEYGWPVHAIQISATLFQYLQRSGHPPDQAAIAKAALQAARQTDDLPAQARALNALGGFEWRRGRFRSAADHYVRALALFGRAGDRTGEAGMLHNLGHVDYGRGAYASATHHFRQALTLYREFGDRAGEGSALNGLGSVAEFLGQFERAAEYYRQALTLCHEIGDRDGEAISLGNLGSVADRLGRYEEAAGHQRRALAMFRQFGDRKQEAVALENLAAVEHRLGRHRRAAEWGRKSLEICRALGDLAGEASARNGLGAALLAGGRRADAEREHSVALTLASQIGHKREQARAHDGLGSCCRADGDVGPAREHWDQALALFTELGMPEADEVRARLDDLGGSA